MLIEVVVFAFGVPVILFGLLLFLARFEADLVQPGEHAARVVELLHSSDEPDEVERATARMLARVAPATSRNGPGDRS